MPPVFGGNAFYVGHLGKVPVYARSDLLFLALYVFLVFGGDPVSKLVLLIVILISILLHELGHAVVANVRGMDGVSITLTGLGGYCSYRGHPDPSRKMLISAAGPLVNFGLAFAAYMAMKYGFLPENALARFTIGAFFYINLFLGILNAVPIYPMDGGQVLQALLQRKMNTATANAVVLRVSVASFVIGLAWYWNYLGTFPFFMAAIGGFLLYQAFRELR